MSPFSFIFPQFPALIAVAMIPCMALAQTNSSPSPSATPATNAPAYTEAYILTPKPASKPRITGPKIFGVRPGNPFLFTVTATGDKPMNFTADNLPSGLSLDPKTGMITGTLKEKGTNSVTLHAKNALGEATRPFRIVCGDTISLTPALGWNSYNCYGKKVDDAKMRSAVDAIVSTGLIDHGWSYINIDDNWEGTRDTNGMIQGNENFPDLKALSDYIHSKGLKFGIYSTPGPWTCAGFEGSLNHEDDDARQYGNWGVDYVKYDSCTYSPLAGAVNVEQFAQLLPPDDATKLRALAKEKLPLDLVPAKKRTEEQKATLEDLNKQWDQLVGKLTPEQKGKMVLLMRQIPYAKFRQSLDKVNRDIVFSYCQYGGAKVWEWGAKLGGNSWRTTVDIIDTWQSMSGIGFGENGHEKFASPGHWNDPDMLIVGKVGWGHPRPSRLTPDEQYTHVSLWALISSPLLIGCDLSQLDDFTKSLLCNDEVLDVNQDPLGKPAGRISQNGDAQVWARDLEDGSKAAGLFNLGDKPMTVSVTWAELGIKGPQVVRDLWRQKDLGTFNDKFEATVQPHGVVLVKITPLDIKPSK